MQRAIDAKIEKLDSQIEVMATMLADLVDNVPAGEEDYEEKPKRRRSEQYLAKLQEASKKTEQAMLETQQQMFLRLANEADSLAKSAGLDMEKSPELREAYIRFLEGKPEEGLEETKKVVANMTEAKGKPKETDIEELKAKLKEELRKEILMEQGLLDADAGQPAGAGKVFTRAQIMAMSDEEYAKNRDAIAKAMVEGRIK
jgi:hypothetical protein